MVSLDDQMASVKREIAMRKNVYPKWELSGRMTQQEADREIAAMTAVLRSLEKLADYQKARQRILLAWQAAEAQANAYSAFSGNAEDQNQARIRAEALADAFAEFDQ